MSVSEICHPTVICIGKQRSALEAARLMRDQHVGSLVVVEDEHEKRRPLGMITDRDIVMELTAADVAAESVTVAEMMSTRIFTVRLDDDVFHAVKLMRTHCVRRLPVINDAERLVGMLSVDNLLDAMAEMLTDLARLTMNEREHEWQQRP